MIYRQQAELLIDTLPLVFQDDRIAMKGGTALNLFLHDMPRLSVDIDITYLPLEDRKTAFSNIHSILSKIQKRLQSTLGCEVNSSQKLDGSEKEVKLVVERNGVQIKVEPNFTIRGAVFSPEKRDIGQKCGKEFGKNATVPCLSRADLYGGKICAALDRQHPRDLFDVKIFFETGGFDRDVVAGFLFYLISHNRPFHEVLRPHLKSLQSSYNAEFLGMTETMVALSDLEETRTYLVSSVLSALTEKDRQFLLSVADVKPVWELYPYPKIQEYPSVRWRLQNLKAMNGKKRKIQSDELKNLLKI